MLSKGPSKHHIAIVRKLVNISNIIEPLVWRINITLHDVNNKLGHVELK